MKTSSTWSQYLYIKLWVILTRREIWERIIEREKRQNNQRVVCVFFPFQEHRSRFPSIISLSLSVFPYLLFPVVGQPLFIGSLSLSISSLRFFGSKDLSILDVKLAIFFFFFFCSVLKPLPRVSYLRSAVEFIFPLKS